MNRKITIGAAITLAFMFSTVTFITTWIYSTKSFNSTVFNIRERETMYAKIKEVDDLVRQQYYHTIDEDVLGEDLVRGAAANPVDVGQANFNSLFFGQVNSGNTCHMSTS